MSALSDETLKKVQDSENYSVKDFLTAVLDPESNTTNGCAIPASAKCKPSTSGY